MTTKRDPVTLAVDRLLRLDDQEKHAIDNAIVRARANTVVTFNRRRHRILCELDEDLRERALKILAYRRGEE